VQAAGRAPLTAPETSADAPTLVGGSGQGLRRFLRRRPGGTSPLIFFGVAAVIVVLDQTAKSLAIAHLDIAESRAVVDGLLHLTLTFNSGAAFSFGTTMTPVFASLALLMVFVIIAVSTVVRSTLWTWALGLLLGGAIGNFTDRLVRAPGPFRGHVVDFLQLPHWPIFNVADMCVVTAALLILLATFTGRAMDGRRLR
jgi:signal peptidase II